MTDNTISKPTRPDALRVIEAVVADWEQTSGLHKGQSEEELTAQIVEALRTAGVALLAEPRSWTALADIIVPPNLVGVPAHLVQPGNDLVANCMIWSGPADFGLALDRLLRGLTKQDRSAALIVFVREGGVMQVVQRAKEASQKHHAFGNFGKGKSETQLELWLSISKHPDKVIPTTLLFCNLFEGVQKGMPEDDGEPEPWEPEYGIF